MIRSQALFTYLATTLVVGVSLASGPARVDRDGDGRSDFIVARRVPEGAAAASSATDQIEWHFETGGGASSLHFGLAEQDFLTPADFDGDGRVDPAVWRTGGPGQAAFYILESSTGTVRTELFGQTGDDPLVVGDYDGGGKADPAVFRCPAQPGQCTFFYRASRDNPERHTTYTPWGFGTANQLFPNPGDFDGDGKFDFCLQQPDPNDPQRGQFLILRSSDFGHETIPWGLASDRVVPGDFDGDGRADFVVIRAEQGRLVWYIHPSGKRSDLQVSWGLEGDSVVAADYDGDGTTDLAVWRAGRASSEPGQFLILESRSGRLRTFSFGRAGDYPVADFPVH